MNTEPLTVQEFRLKLYPRDFTRVRVFYESTLAFPIVHEWDHGEADRGVMFNTGAAIIELLSPESPRTEHIPPTGCDISLHVQNVWDLWEQLQHTCTIIFPLRDNAWGDTSFAIADPEGFEITFFTTHI